MKVSVGIVDDNQLFVKSLGALINTFEGFEVTLDALDGEELLKKISAGRPIPEVMLLDVSMPAMNGMATAKAVIEKYPLLRIAALSQRDDDISIIGMIRSGCCAYLLKDIHAAELERALAEIHQKGYYNADYYNINYRRRLNQSEKRTAPALNDRELQFLQLACSDLTYKQIAAEMNLAERTIDGYREAIFEKFNVQSRTGMALEAIKRKFVQLV